MTNPSDNPREGRIRQRFEALLRKHDDELHLGEEVIAEFVCGLTFFATDGRPVFRIVSNNLPPAAVMALADRAVDEILAEERASA